MPRWSSTFSMPGSSTPTVRFFSSTSKSSPGTSRVAMRANSVNQRFASPEDGPEMMSGVRASSMRIESTSSTTAKKCPRCTMSLDCQAMLSRR